MLYTSLQLILCHQCCLRLYFISTWLVDCENHFSSPSTVSTLLEGFFLQISGSPCLISRRWRQSTCEHASWLWPVHFSSGQYGQATQIWYWSPRRYSRSCDKDCSVASTNSRTWIAASLPLSPETCWSWDLCMTKNLMYCFLQKRTKSWTVRLPMTNHAPFRYRVGGWVGPASEHQRTSRETSRVNKPWGTKPATKKTYRGQGSECEGTMAQRESGGTLSWDGTKYFSSVLGGENFAIKPNCSIRSRMSSLTKSFRRNLENTCSTSSMLRTPLSLSFSQCLETFGSWEIIN